MICEQCQQDGKTSTIQVGISGSTLVWCPPFYDEQGIYHIHDSNTITTQYKCSNGHNWAESTHKECPTCGKWWEKP